MGNRSNRHEEETTDLWASDPEDLLLDVTTPRLYLVGGYTNVSAYDPFEGMELLAGFDGSFQNQTACPIFPSQPDGQFRLALGEHVTASEAEAHSIASKVEIALKKESVLTIEGNRGLVRSLVHLPPSDTISDDRLLSGSHGIVFVANLETGEDLLDVVWDERPDAEKSESPYVVSKIVTDPNATTHAYVAGEPNRLLDFDLVENVSLGAFEGHEAWVADVALADENSLVTTCHDKQIRVFDRSTHECTRSIPLSDMGTCVLFSPETNLVVSGTALDNGGFDMYDIRGGDQPVASLEQGIGGGNSATALCSCGMPNGKALFVGIGGWFTVSFRATGKVMSKRNDNPMQNLDCCFVGDWSAGK